MEKKKKFLSLSVEKIRQILYSYPSNQDLFDNPQHEEPHVVRIITQQTRKTKDEKVLPKFLQKANRDDTPEGIRELPNDYIRVMIYPFKDKDVITLKDGTKKDVIRPAGRGTPFNIFRSSEPKLYSSIANEIIAENYEMDKTSSDEQPEAELTNFMYGKIVNIVVPAYTIHFRNENGAMEELLANTRNKETGSWDKRPATLAVRRIFIHAGNLERGQLENFVLTDIQNWVAPFFVKEETVQTRSSIGAETLSEETEDKGATLTGEENVERKQVDESEKKEDDNDLLEGVEEKAI